MSALTRELEEARKRAGDASEEAARLRETLTATEKDAAFWRREARTAEAHCNRAHEVIAAVEAALPGCTGDLARDVAGLVATLREHEIALARATPLLNACDTLTALDCTLHVETRDGDHAWCRDDDETFAGAIVSMTPEVVAVMRTKAPLPPEELQLPETPATCEAPHRVGDTWRDPHGADYGVRDVAPATEGAAERVTLGGIGRIRPEYLRAHGWRRVRCAPEAPKVAPAEVTCAECGGAGRVDAGPQSPTRGNAGFDTKACTACRGWGVRDALAVGDPVRVRLGDREAVGTVTRSPADGTLEAWRVAGAEGQELYAREADIERVAVEGAK